MKISIVGTGYVGLVTGACFAKLGHDVTCIDIDANKIDLLNGGKVPIYEPGLEEIIKEARANKALAFTSELEASISSSDAIFIAVGTPTGAYTGQADLSYVHAVAKDIAPYLKEDAVIVVKSTVPVKSGERVRQIIHNERPDLAFHTASNPEFLREGCAIKDFLEPDRIIVGVDSAKAKETLKTLYKPLLDKDIPIVFTDIKSAELAKYAANAFLATKIAFINEIADMCEAVGANVEDLARGIGLDHRIGLDYLKPGPGFGGSCFPKDTKALLHTSEKLGVPSLVVGSVITANERRKNVISTKIIRSLGGDLHGKKVAVLGLAFKANTDDMRDSPALAVIPTLVEAGAKVQTYDPEATKNAQTMLKSSEISWEESIEACLKGVDAAVILTEWAEFADIDWRAQKSNMGNPCVIDYRNLFSPEEMEAAGIEYISVGRVSKKDSPKKPAAQAVS